MALPTSGPMTAAMINAELGRAANAAFSLNGAAERALAGVSSGAISMASFYGKSSEIVVNMAAGGSAITLESLFSATDWASSTQKRVILPAGVERGNSANINAAVTIGSNAWGGNLIFEVRGTISGRGGAANSGVGGNAFQANRVGNANQKLQLILTGTLRGGGGGGGKGGAGGNGSSIVTVREPATGYSYSNSGEGSRGTAVFIYAYDDYWATIQWNNTMIASSPDIPQAGPYTASDGWTYEWSRDIAYSYGIGMWDFAVARYKNTGGTTTGGAGGNGGQGGGYSQTRADGSAGAAGGANAGTGGTGGAGGLYGASGATGATGTNGNTSSGASGAVGGLAGYGLLGSANVNLTNNGTILGRTG